jgi:transcriptional regulator with XRE-family HTH domain
MKKQTTFGERIQAARIAAGLTQQQLAERAGMSIKTVQAYEQANRDPLIHPFFQLCRALELDPASFADVKKIQKKA